MNGDRVAQIRKRLEEATPGPWVAKHLYQGNLRHTVYRKRGSLNLPRRDVMDAIARSTPNFCEEQQDANIDFIAHSHEDITYLLDALDDALMRANAAEESLAMMMQGCH